MTIFSSSPTVTNFLSILQPQELAEVVAISQGASEEEHVMGVARVGHGELWGLEGSHRL